MVLEPEGEGRLDGPVPSWFAGKRDDAASGRLVIRLRKERARWANDEETAKVRFIGGRVMGSGVPRSTLGTLMEGASVR